MDDPMRITRDVALPLSEVTVRASRSSGPGGQHANVTASRIEAVFVVADSATLQPWQKERITARLGPRVTAVAQDARSQAQNRELALGRLRERLAAALAVPRHRTPTRPPRASRRRVAQTKQRHSARKRDRRPPRHDD
ncbi:aminoacyl-tRNA hydrolase [Conexibacter sp. CPCC 206217]|uniref:aminoacyl-tRNA hydrolase n=1 Tax=Conexibacter sp. CPCC 206217 TaxID=3064574 RepID=UPI0027217251|nr:aminoacyl-tRNA hydrolase [Conexibacter sp. CPCC 206217]MDO8211341.1 aminoacyl-tRNA hydrolase [Conexibacter sp. CPCC 206217]